MTCEKCGSAHCELTHSAVFKDTYTCRSCGTNFKVPTGITKAAQTTATVVGMAGPVVAVLSWILVGPSIPAGDKWLKMD